MAALSTADRAAALAAHFATAEGQRELRAAPRVFEHHGSRVMTVDDAVTLLLEEIANV